MNAMIYQVDENEAEICSSEIELTDGEIHLVVGNKLYSFEICLDGVIKYSLPNGRCKCEIVNGFEVASVKFISDRIYAKPEDRTCNNCPSNRDGCPGGYSGCFESVNMY